MRNQLCLLYLIKLQSSEAAEIVKDICIAVKFLHDMNMAHRDLKPENLLYTRKGRTVIAKMEVFWLNDFCLRQDLHLSDIPNQCLD